MITNNIDRKIIITADDYGASVNINEGILIAAGRGSITTVSALTNFTESLGTLRKLADENPEIGVGVHLNIVTGKPILDPGMVKSLVDMDGNFYPLEKILKRLKSISHEELKNELRAQIIALSSAGIRVDHLSDQCGIISLYSPFFDIIIDLALEYDLPVRSPVIAGIKYPRLFSNSSLRKRGRRLVAKFALSSPFKAISLAKYTSLKEMSRKASLLEEKGIPHTDLFVESFWGDPSSSNFMKILDNLPEGSSEIVVHLGSSARQENYPTGLETDYFERREQELETIADKTLSEYIKLRGFILSGYSQLSK